MLGNAVWARTVCKPRELSSAWPVHRAIDEYNAEAMEQYKKCMAQCHCGR